MSAPMVDQRLINTIYAEAGGGGPEEIAAVASAYLNRAAKQGMDKALAGSSAYRFRSPQYIKASTGNMNPYEKQFYSTIAATLGDLTANPSKIQPWTHHENVKVYGHPKWESDMATFKDIGRQRFYVEKSKAKAKALAAQDPYTTKLSPQEEAVFQGWKSKYAPRDSGRDYDLRGAFKANLKPGPDGHWSDAYKKPGHPTFSNESIYARQRPDLAGHWEGNTYVPPKARAVKKLGTK